MLKIMSSSKFFSVFVLSVITIMITIAFLFWGIGPADNPIVDTVARVDDIKITLDQYWREYDKEYKSRKDRGVSPEELEKADIKDIVLERLINRSVLMIVAEKAGISVTEEELQNTIIKNPYFQREGVFDQDIYMRALRLNRIAPRDYENSLRNDIIVSKVSRLIEETVELTNEEMKIIDSIQDSNKTKLSEVFRRSKGNLAIQAYIRSIRQKMDISINKDIVF